ncbi:hypothetical protein Tco_0745850 [Tanacetum coccineum]
MTSPPHHHHFSTLQVSPSPPCKLLPQLTHKVVQAYDATDNELPIPPQALIAPPTILPLFNLQEFFLPEELLPLKKQGRDRSSSSTSALPQELEIGESSHKTSLERQEEQIEEILNHLDELSLDRH